MRKKIDFRQTNRKTHSYDDYGDYFPDRRNKKKKLQDSHRRSKMKTDNNLLKKQIFNTNDEDLDIDTSDV